MTLEVAIVTRVAVVVIRIHLLSRRPCKSFGVQLHSGRREQQQVVADKSRAHSLTIVNLNLFDWQFFPKVDLPKG